VRLLIDENVSPIIGLALRAAGHDVIAAADVCAGAPDDDVVRLSIAEERIIVSEDKDFGDLVFRLRLRPPGVILVRLSGRLPAEKAARLVDVLKGENADDCILVIEPRRTRRRPLP
jgi:predicted nuclease of predicted toxin-antitoxin system